MRREDTLSFDVPEPPDNHFITVQRAKELIAGDLGDVYRGIVRNCMVPIYWNRPFGTRIGTNGTITIVKSDEAVFGITAAHVIASLRCDMNWAPVNAYIYDINFKIEIIDINYEIDLATIKLPDQIMKSVGRDIVPVYLSKYIPVREGRGVLIGGYPGNSRIEYDDSCNFGIFVGLGVARRVYDDKITWSPDPSSVVHSSKIPTLPEGYELGGISGGPFIGKYERAGLEFMQLAGIITEARSDIQNVIAAPASFIAPDGKILKSV